MFTCLLNIWTFLRVEWFTNFEQQCNIFFKNLYISATESLTSYGAELSYLADDESYLATNEPDRTCCPLPETICFMSCLNIVVHQAKHRTYTSVRVDSIENINVQNPSLISFLVISRQIPSVNLKENNVMNNNSVIK